jgi:hypothetical protein
MKMKYVPPKVGVHRIELEENIAMALTQSTVSVEEWEVDTSPPGEDEGDIWITVLP